jgi:hypothetical protein
MVEQMKVELAANSGKGDRFAWMHDPPRVLLAEVQHHYVKLHAAVVEMDRYLSSLDHIDAGGRAPRPLPWIEKAPTPPELRRLIAEYAADVANMAMMVADRCHAFDSAIREVDHAA